MFTVGSYQKLGHCLQLTGTLVFVLLDRANVSPHHIFHRGDLVNFLERNSPELSA
jgi:hypothetical protein